MISGLGNQKGAILATVIMILVAVAGMAAAGWWAYGRFLHTEIRLKLDTVKVKPEVMEFVNRSMPKVYSRLIALDDDALLMKNEIKRLEAILKKFPDQKELVSKRLEFVQQTRSQTAATIKDIAARINTIYVTWLLDRLQGKRAISKNRIDLLKTMAAARKKSAKLAARLRANGKTLY